jgi:hypothetical protein
VAVEGATKQHATDVTVIALLIAAVVAVLAAPSGSASRCRGDLLADVDQPGCGRYWGATGRRPRRSVSRWRLAALGGRRHLASLVFPIGIARKAEPRTGIDVDGLVLTAGFAALVLVVLVMALVGGMRTARAARQASAARGPTAAARAVADLHLAPTARIGVQFALDRGSGRRPLPVRSSVAGATFGVLVVVAVLVFGASLRHVVDTPAVYGWTWDLVVTDAEAREASRLVRVDTRLTELEAVQAVLSVCNVEVQVADTRSPVGGSPTSRASVRPSSRVGRQPRSTRSHRCRDARGHRRGVGDVVLIEGSQGRHATAPWALRHSPA